MSETDKNQIYKQAVQNVHEAHQGLLDALKKLNYHPKMRYLKKLDQHLQIGLKAFDKIKKESRFKKVVASSELSQPKSEKVNQEVFQEQEVEGTLLATNANADTKAKKKRGRPRKNEIAE